MTIEEMSAKRIETIALMAATIEAGDRAHKTAPIESPQFYAARASELYDEVVNREVPMPTGFVDLDMRDSAGRAP